jgi:hypothetical protein
MVPATPQVVSTSTQAWKLIEPDYTLRLSLVAHTWASDHELAKRILFAEAHNSGSGAYLGPAWIKLEIEEMNRRAEWADNICSEIWEIQGREKCSALFRAIFDLGLQPMFSTRIGCFEGDLARISHER